MRRDFVRGEEPGRHPGAARAGLTAPSRDSGARRSAVRKTACSNFVHAACSPAMQPLIDIQPAIPAAAGGVHPTQRSAIRQAYVRAVATGAAPEAALPEAREFARALLPALPTYFVHEATVDVANG